MIYCYFRSVEDFTMLFLSSNSYARGLSCKVFHVCDRVFEFQHEEVLAWFHRGLNIADLLLHLFNYVFWETDCIICIRLHHILAYLLVDFCYFFTVCRTLFFTLPVIYLFSYLFIYLFTYLLICLLTYSPFHLISSSPVYLFALLKVVWFLRIYWMSRVNKAFECL